MFSWVLLSQESKNKNKLLWFSNCTQVINFADSTALMLQTTLEQRYLCALPHEEMKKKVRWILPISVYNFTHHTVNHVAIFYK